MLLGPFANVAMAATGQPQMITFSPASIAPGDPLSFTFSLPSQTGPLYGGVASTATPPAQMTSIATATLSGGLYHVQWPETISASGIYAVPFYAEPPVGGVWVDGAPVAIATFAVGTGGQTISTQITLTPNTIDANTSLSFGFTIPGGPASIYAGIVGPITTAQPPSDITGISTFSSGGNGSYTVAWPNSQINIGGTYSLLVFASDPESLLSPTVEPIAAGTFTAFDIGTGSNAEFTIVYKDSDTDHAYFNDDPFSASITVASLEQIPDIYKSQITVTAGILTTRGSKELDTSQPVFSEQPTISELSGSTLTVSGIINNPGNNTLAPGLIGLMIELPAVSASIGPLPMIDASMKPALVGIGIPSTQSEISAAPALSAMENLYNTEQAMTFTRTDPASAQVMGSITFPAGLNIIDNYLQLSGLYDAIAIVAQEPDYYVEVNTDSLIFLQDKNATVTINNIPYTAVKVICDNPSGIANNLQFLNGTLTFDVNHFSRYTVLNNATPVTPPSFSPEAGSYTQATTVSMTAASGASIYYTTDGTNPITSSTRKLYVGPINLTSGSTSIKATAFISGNYSGVSEAQYLLGTGSILGTVSYRGTPVSGQSIQLKKNGNIVATTVSNASGTYQFTKLANGAAYTVAAGGENGFSVQESNLVTATLEGTVQNIVLLKGGTISGIIQDGAGSIPIRGVQVCVGTVGTSGITGSSSANAESDEQGHFLIENLPSGNYQIYTYNTLGYTDYASASNIPVIEGQLSNIGTISLSKPSSASLSGRATDQGTGVAGLNVSAYSLKTGGWGYAVTDTSGNYSMNGLLPSNDYEISYYKWDYASQTMGYLFDIDITSGQNTQDIIIPISYSISGQVTDIDNNPIAEVNVWTYGQNGYQSAVTDQNGGYTIKGLHNGEYTLELDSGSKFYIDERASKQVTIADSSISGHDIKLVPGGIISGKVTTDPAGAQKAVRISAYSSNLGIYRNTTTAADGSYILRGIKNGSYEISAYKYEYISAPQTVEVTEGSKSNVNFNLKSQYLNAPYFGGEGNRFLAVNPSVAPGQIVNLRMDYQNNNTIASGAAVAAITLPADLALVPGSIKVNGNAAADDLNAILIGIVNAGQKGTISLQATVNTTVQELSLRADAKITHNSNDETIGNMIINIARIELNGPSFSKPGKVTVYGKCMEGAEVTVFGRKTNEQAAVALTKAAAEGKWWTANIELPAEGTYEIYAIARQGEVSSEPSKVLPINIKDNTAVLAEATINAGWNRNVKSNPKTGIPAIAVTQGYYVQVDTAFSNAVDTSDGLPLLLYGLKDDSLKPDQAETADFRQAVRMSGSATSFNGSFQVDYESSGDITAYVRYKTEGQWQTIPVAVIQVLIDPSGIVTDAHTGAPVQDVKAVCEYLTGGVWKFWPAENYGQANPQYTDEKGTYGWDVPAGQYRVVFTRDGYQAFTSETVTVPPPKTDLNPGLVQLGLIAKPGIASKTPAADATGVSYKRNQASISVTFTKDMDASTITTDSFILKDGDTPVPAAAAQVNARTFTLTPNADLAFEKTYTVELAATIKDAANPAISYAGGAAIDPFVWEFTTMANTVNINAAAQLSKYANSTATRPINITLVGNLTADSIPAGTTISLIVRDSDQQIIGDTLTDVSVEADGSFQGTWSLPVSADAGQYSVEAVYNNNTYVGSSFTVVQIGPITVSPGAGSYNSIQQVSLSSTAGAVIYYTLDGSTPTLNSSVYNSALTIDHSLTLKAIAVKEGIVSELGSFSYVITPSGGNIDECFIATASFGSKFEPAVVLLRHFRDDFLLTNQWGTAFVKFYYENSPPIAAIIAQNEPLKLMVRVLLLPFIAVAYSLYHPISIVILLLLIAGLVLIRPRKKTAAQARL